MPTVSRACAPPPWRGTWRVDRPMHPASASASAATPRGIAQRDLPPPRGCTTVARSPGPSVPGAGLAAPPSSAPDTPYSSSSLRALCLATRRAFFCPRPLDVRIARAAAPGRPAQTRRRHRQRHRPTRRPGPPKRTGKRGHRGEEAPDRRAEYGRPIRRGYDALFAPERPVSYSSYQATPTRARVVDDPGVHRSAPGVPPQCPPGRGRGWRGRPL